MLNGTPHAVDEIHISGSGQAKHRTHARLRNLNTGRHTDQTFQDGDHIELAELEYRKVTFSYIDGDQFVFLDAGTYEEYRLLREQIGERHWLLKEDCEYNSTFLKGSFLDIILPEHISLKVVETAPPQRAAQHSSMQKQAKLEGGLEIKVPLFIAPGEEIRVSTATRKYSGKE